MNSPASKKVNYAITIMKILVHGCIPRFEQLEITRLRFNGSGNEPEVDGGVSLADVLGTAPEPLQKHVTHDDDRIYPRIGRRPEPECLEIIRTTRKT